MSESLQKTLYVKLQELIAFQSEGEWDDATVNGDARDFTAELMPLFAALEAERDALRKDAERYRYLRDNATSVQGSGGKFDLPKYGVINFSWHKIRYVDGKPVVLMEADAAIDAAIAAKDTQS